MAVGDNIYKRLSQTFTFPNEDQEQWWHSTAPMFLNLLKAANYTREHITSQLTTYKECVIPHLGVYPVSPENRWRSVMAVYNLPFQLSFNCSGNVVRYAYDPVHAGSGTAEDPFNADAGWPALASMMHAQKGIDTRWFEHFYDTLVLDNEGGKELLARGNWPAEQPRTQTLLAVDLKGGKQAVKCYLYPQARAAYEGISVPELIYNSADLLARKHGSIRPALEQLKEYTATRGPELALRFVSCDMVDPAKSRLKLYFMQTHISLAELEHLWTLGGRRVDESAMEGLELLRELWEVLRLEDKDGKAQPAPCLDVGVPPEGQYPMLVNYTLHHDDDMPEPQVYIPLFGGRDARIVERLAEYFRRRGWDEMADRYGPAILDS